MKYIVHGLYKYIHFNVKRFHLNKNISKGILQITSCDILISYDDFFFGNDFLIVWGLRNRFLGSKRPNNIIRDRGPKWNVLLGHSIQYPNQHVMMMFRGQWVIMMCMNMIVHANC